MSVRLAFADVGEAADLAAFLGRLIHYDKAAAVRLQAGGAGEKIRSLAVFGRPPSFEVLAIRTARLADPVELDVTVSAGELLESVDESAGTAEVPAAVTGPRGPVCCRPAAAGSSSTGCRRRTRCARRSRRSSPNSVRAPRSCRPRAGPVPNSTASAARSGPGRWVTPSFPYGRRMRPSRSVSCGPSGSRSRRAAPAGAALRAAGRGGVASAAYALWIGRRTQRVGARRAERDSRVGRVPPEVAQT